MKRLTYAQALNAGLHEEMAADSRVIVFGEDVASAGGRYGVTRGLLQRFGPLRIMDTPINEEIFVGVGLGAAVGGLKPVVEVLCSDFLRISFDDLHRAALWRRLNSLAAAPTLIVRSTFGGYVKKGPEFSGSRVAELLCIPELKVLVPSSPQDAGDLLRGALREGGVSVLLEHKALYHVSGEVENGPILPPGRSRLLRRGNDCLIIAYSRMVPQALTVSDRLLERRGLHLGILDLRTLAPIDWDGVLEAAQRAGKVVIAEECPTGTGVADRIEVRIRRQFPSCHIETVHAKSDFVPFGPDEDRVLPGDIDLEQACLRLTGICGGLDSLGDQEDVRDVAAHAGTPARPS